MSVRPSYKPVDCEKMKETYAAIFTRYKGKERKGKYMYLTCNSKADKISLVYHTNQKIDEKSKTKGKKR